MKFKTSTSLPRQIKLMSCISAGTPDYFPQLISPSLRRQDTRPVKHRAEAAQGYHAIAKSPTGTPVFSPNHILFCSVRRALSRVQSSVPRHTSHTQPTLPAHQATTTTNSTRMPV
ncbi:hypothetical protein BJX62DRAFT_211142 [Aspergillus germanicus]